MMGVMRRSQTGYRYRAATLAYPPSQDLVCPIDLSITDMGFPREWIIPLLPCVGKRDSENELHSLRTAVSPLKDRVSEEVVPSRVIIQVWLHCIVL